MKTAIRTPIVEAIRAAIKGFGGLSAIFHWPGTHTLAATTGTDPTFTRATSATFEDFEGVIRTAESSEPRFVGARRVENLVPASEDFTNVGWLKNPLNAGSTVVLVDANYGTITDGDGNVINQQRWTFEAGGTSSADRSRLYDQGTMSAGESFSASVWLSVVSGTQDMVFSTANTWAVENITLTTTPQRFSVAGAYGTPATVVGFLFLLQATGDVSGAAAFDVIIGGAQSENVTGQTNQNPSEYVSTGVGTGAEFVTNGTFATDSDWTKGTGWTIGSGVATRTNTGASTNLTQTDSIPFNAGQDYVVSYDLTRTSGSIKVAFTGGTATGGSFRSTSGSYSQVLTAQSGNNALQFQATTAFAGSIDNISIKEASHGANIDGVQYFNTLNANTVTANVVTEAVGSPLTRANTQFGELPGIGTPASYFSTPNVVTTWGELDIRARAQIDSIPNFWQFLADKQGSFFLGMLPNGATQRLALRISGGVDRQSILFPTSQFGVRNWYRVTYDPSTGDANFFTADGNLEAPEISDYVQLGTTQNSGAAAIAVTTTPFTAGSFGNSTAYPFDGRIYRSQVFNEIDGTTPVVDFDFGDYVSGSTWEGIPYGPELITNGDFATDSDWTKGAGWTISAGSATHTGGVASYLSQDVLTPNSLYKVEIEVLQADGSNFIQLYLGNSPALETITAAGSYTFSLTSQPTDLIGFSIRGIGNAKVDNISVRNIPVFTLVGNASVFQPPVDASGPFGYLAEGARTNLCLYSEDFTTSNWLQSVTVQADQATAPDGTLTADKVTGASSGRLYQNITVLASTDYTFSLWVNSVDMTTFPIQAMNASGLANILTVDVISSLTVGAFSRVELSFNTGTATSVRLYVGCTGSSGGWILGEQAYLWGAQLEQSTYPTSYIATAAAAVTRNADTLLAGDMVTDAAGSGYVEVSQPDGVTANAYALNRSALGRILYKSTTAVNDNISAYDGTNGSDAPNGPSRASTPISAVSTWGDALTAYYNAAPDATPAAYDGTMGTGNLGIGNNQTGSEQWNGTVREVKIFDDELTAAEVADL